MNDYFYSMLRDAQIHHDIGYPPYHRSNLVIPYALPEVYMNNRHFYLLIGFFILA